MNILTNLIERCHQRHKKPLQQRKTVVTPALYKDCPFYYKVHCSRRHPQVLDDLERADISFMPIGRAPEDDKGPKDYGGDRFLRRQSTDDWRVNRWIESWGMQIYTGIPSEQAGARWHDIHFTYQAICDAPDAVLACVEKLIRITAKPLLTMTKSGGIRFSCRVPDYLHPYTDAAKFYIYKYLPISDDQFNRNVFLEILGDRSYSRWDARYEILLGNLLDPPVITRELLFVPIDTMRDALHEPEPPGTIRPKTGNTAPPSLGSKNLNLAKDAFIKRGFSYLQRDKDFHHWIHQDSNGDNIYAWLWEDWGNVWVRGSAPISGLPRRAMLITDVWDDTGIPAPTSSAVPVTDKVQSVREGKLSPLAIKRPRPLLYKDESTKKVYGTLEETSTQIRSVFKMDARIIGVNTETSSVPFTFQRAKAKIIPSNKLLLDPNYAPLAEKILAPVDDTERVCIIEDRKTEDLFLKCELLKSVLERWEVDWQGRALAYLANALLNALKQRGQPYDNPIPRIRAAVEAFQQHEDELIQQMCQLNMQGKVVEHVHVDAKTKQELTRFAIEFEDGTILYIPLNVKAENILKANGMPCFLLDRSFNLNEDIRIPMSMAGAIEIGILDTDSVEKILLLPTVCRYPNWTFWHQLKRFFAYYKRDTDAPMQWSGEKLIFFVPPMLHPSVKRLMVISPTLSENYLRRVFPDEEIEFVRTKQTAWVPGNKVFQLRSVTFTYRTILNIDNSLDIPSMSKIGERIFMWIGAEINRDLSVKHAIITNKSIIELLKDLSEKENVSFVTYFKAMYRDEIDFQDVDVAWIVGTPHWSERFRWRRVQMLYGNDEEPLNYEGSSETNHFKDKRVQSVYLHNIAGLLSHFIGKIGMNRCGGKSVMLLTNFALPDITDRPETQLFDWEDFEIAGELDKLPEVIDTRERFEAERDNLTANSSREEVERILGCGSRQANRVLQKLRGGNILRVSFREQVLTLLKDGEKKTAELTEAIEGHPVAIKLELKRLVDAGEIVRVRRGVYTLPQK